MSKKNKKHTHKVNWIYKIGLVVSFVFLKVIKPLWGEKDRMSILRGMGKVSLSNIGVININENKYLTRNSGWEQLDALLKKKGYNTHIVFRNCEFWRDNEEKKYLKGKNVGEYFILWEGDKI